jgi:DNA (cytosine-5)-methyltransferase 1
MSSKQRPLRVGTDCSGVDAPIVALNALKIPHKHVFSSEINIHCINMIKANHKPDIIFGDPDGPYPDGNIATRKINTVPDIDLYICGFPCQPFSRVNMSQTKGFGHRSFIFDHVFKVIKTKKPKYFILENVKGLTTCSCKDEWEYIQNKLGSLNKLYNIEWDILNTQHYGIPQNRERLYILGVQKPRDVVFPTPTTRYTIKNTPLKNYIDYSCTEKDKITLKKLQDAFDSKKIKNDVIFVNTGTIGIGGENPCVNHNIRCPCLLTNDKLWCVPLHRHATNKEYLKLQGFPLSTKVVVSDRQLNRQMGNSMSINVLKAIFKCLKI